MATTPHRKSRRRPRHGRSGLKRKPRTSKGAEPIADRSAAQGSATVAFLLQRWPTPYACRPTVAPRASVGRKSEICVRSQHGLSRPAIDTGTRMRFLSFAYRFLTNFGFLAMVYLSLSYIEKYNNRAIL